MIYDRYAALYDGSGQIRFALLVTTYLAEILAHHPVSGRRMLDLACGTGTLAIEMADQGWDVIGLDRSPAMIRQAQAKVEATHLRGSLSFVVEDMRYATHSLPSRSFDLVTCTYDSLNYLTSESDLFDCFRSISDALVPGGLFVGDMNTRHFLEFEWGVCAIREQTGFVQVEQSYFDRWNATSTMVLTGFVGDDQGGYERFDEVHVERAYPPDLVEDLLMRAGLQIEAQYDSFTFSPPHAQSQRIFWVARRRAE